MIEPLDALLETVRAGTGALVVVEGQTARDDPFYYGRWFGDLGREIRFVHQNGYSMVKKAVAHLRERAPGRPVFGIIDRDFASRDPTDATETLEPGMFRTGLYTLENYFFIDPGAWLRVVEVLSGGEPAPGWRSVDDLRARIVEAYRAALPVAAWNFVVHAESTRARVETTNIEYRVHPSAISEGALSKLAQWGTDRAAPRSLREAYEARLAELTALAPQTWPEHVTGKAVGAVFTAAFPALHNTKNKDVSLYRLYMDKQTTRPADLAEILEIVRREAAKLRRRG